MIQAESLTPPANAGGVSVSKTRESSSGLQPSRASIESGGVYAGFAAISSEGSLLPRHQLV